MTMSLTFASPVLGPGVRVAVVGAAALNHALGPHLAEPKSQ